MIILRVICVGAALSVIAFLTATGLDPAGVIPVVGLLLVVFPLSAVWWMLYKSGYALRPLLYAQVIADLLVIGGMVYLTGGAYSHLTALFVVTIFLAGVLLCLKGALIAASLSTALFATASLVHEFAIDRSIGIAPEGRQTAYIILNIALQSAFFYLIASLGGHVSRRVRAFGVRLKDTTTELQRTRMDTNLIIESMNSGLITMDSRYVIGKVNHAAARILGLTPEDLRGKRLHDILGDMAPEMVKKAVAAIEDGREEKRAEVDAENLGVRVPLGLSVSLMTDQEGNRTGAVCVFQDLTEVKAMEEKIRVADRLAALGELSAGIAHEIRTPLASICGSVEMLRDALPKVGEDRKLVDLVVKESERLRGIIDHFLQFARSRPARFSPMSLNSILDEVVCMVENHPRFVDGLVVSLNAPVEVTLPVDAENVKQVFYNLAVNAIEAMSSPGQLEITLEGEIERDSLRYARVTFKDDGEGMDDEVVEHVFRPFYTGKSSGTGLGLAIASKIVEEHSGTIELRSTRGEGTVVSVYLPLERDRWGEVRCEAIPESGLVNNS
jgi:two-component system sensor histidine kinase PilS (NtrC family)